MTFNLIHVFVLSLTWGVPTSHLVAEGAAHKRNFPTWGGVPQWSCNVKMTNPADSKGRPTWNFTYFYDALYLVDRYEHGVGQGDELCGGIAAFETGKSCIVVNAADGNTYVTSADEKCCRFPTFIGAIKPDWLRNGTRNGTREINGVEMDVWTVQGQYVKYYASALHSENRPVRFWEHKDPGPLGLKQWDFDLASFQVGTPGPQLFAPGHLPGGCKAAGVCDWHQPS